MPVDSLEETVQTDLGFVLRLQKKVSSSDEAHALLSSLRGEDLSQVSCLFIYLKGHINKEGKFTDGQGKAMRLDQLPKLFEGMMQGKPVVFHISTTPGYTDRDCAELGDANFDSKLIKERSLL